MRCRVDVQVENVAVREVVWDGAGEFGVAGRRDAANGCEAVPGTLLGAIRLKHPNGRPSSIGQPQTQNAQVARQFWPRSLQVLSEKEIVVGSGVKSSERIRRHWDILNNHLRRSVL